MHTHDVLDFNFGLSIFKKKVNCYGLKMHLKVDFGFLFWVSLNILTLNSSLAPCIFIVNLLHRDVYLLSVLTSACQDLHSWLKTRTAHKRHPRTTHCRLLIRSEGNSCRIHTSELKEKRDIITEASFQCIGPCHSEPNGQCYKLIKNVYIYLREF